MGQSNSSALLAEKCADYPYDDYYGGNINTTEENDYIDPGYLNSDSAGLQLVLKAFFSVLCFFGLMANLIVLVVTAQYDRAKNKPSNIYLLLLSMADVIFLTCMMLKVFYDGQHNFPFSTNTCKLFNGLDIAAQNMSALLLAGIAWDRLLLLFCPARRTNKIAWMLCLVAFTLSGSASIPYWISHRVVANCELEIMTCGFILVNETTNEVINESDFAIEFGLRSTIVTFITSYVITLVHLILFGTLIIGKVYLVARRTQAAYNNPRANQYQRIVTIRIFSLIGSFVICHTPFWIMTILNEISEWYQYQWISEVWYIPVFKCAIYLANTNSAVNPMLYAAMNDDFKHHLRMSVAYLKQKLSNPQLSLFRSFLNPSNTQEYPVTQSLQLLTTPDKQPKTDEGQDHKNLLLEGQDQKNLLNGTGNDQVFV